MALTVRPLSAKASRGGTGSARGCSYLRVADSGVTFVTALVVIEPKRAISP